MGHHVSALVSGLGRFFEYPVKRKPICFYRQEDFTATGEPQRRVSEIQTGLLTDYDILVDQFYKSLAEQRQYNQEMKEQDRRWSMQKVVRRFPGWNEVTIANLHSLFLLFDNQSNGMLGFDDFCAVLESLGDETSMETRKKKFNQTDTDTDGWITYDEFLSLVYNFSPQKDGELSGLAGLCNEQSRGCWQSPPHGDQYLLGASSLSESTSLSSASAGSQARQPPASDTHSSHSTNGHKRLVHDRHPAGSEDEEALIDFWYTRWRHRDIFLWHAAKPYWLSFLRWIFESVI